MVPGNAVPWVTILIVGVTAVIASLGFVDPNVLSALRRDPGALAAGQWWRLLTPLLVRTDGWLVLALILAFTLAAGALVEQLLGIPQLLLLYFAAGVAGQAFGYAWEPHGAGSSVAMLGLVSGLWVMTLAAARRAPLRVRVVVAAGLCLVAALLAGALLGSHRQRAGGRRDSCGRIQRGAAIQAPAGRRRAGRGWTGGGRTPDGAPG